MIRAGKSIGSLVLDPLSRLYTAVVDLDRRRMQARRYRSGLPVVSVGALSVGGAGKTPVALQIVSMIQQHRPVVFLSRGYRRTDKRPLVWRPGDVVPGCDQLGDEPTLATRVITNGAVAVAGDRVSLLRQVESLIPEALVVLDDGFQHHRLARDLDIVIVDDPTARFPFVMPKGRLREHPRGLARADIILASSDRAVTFAQRFVGEQGEVMRVRFRAGPLYHWVDGSTAGAPVQPSILVTGIARPERVVKDLERVGAVPGDHVRFGDHHRYDRRDVERIMQRMHSVGASAIVTTAKDAVKLEAFQEVRDLLYVLRLDVEFEHKQRLVERVLAAAVGR
jgi:tetraacyldisaccharide 4'-kinase